MVNDSTPSEGGNSSVETQRAVADLAALLVDAACETARRQWTLLHAVDGSDHLAATVLDPEALLLLSVWLMPRESALHQTVHGWVESWSDLLSVQRTRNLAKGFSGDVQQRLRDVAITAHERGKDFRWAPLIQGGVAAGQKQSVDDVANVDTSATRVRGGGVRLPVRRAALLMLRFRMAFGVGARADALAFLLARGAEWSTVTGISQATGYTPSAIRRALDRMAEAEIVRMVDDGTTRYRCEPGPWAALLGLDAGVAPWAYWLQQFVFIATFVEWAEGVARRKLTSYAITEGMRAVARNFRPTADREALLAWDHAFRDGSSLAEMELALAGIASEL